MRAVLWFAPRLLAVALVALLVVEIVNRAAIGYFDVNDVGELGEDQLSAKAKR